MIELKPCPFCGGDAEVGEEQESIFDPEPQFYYIYCEFDCATGCKAPTLDKAARIWNTRVTDAIQMKGS